MKILMKALFNALLLIILSPTVSTLSAQGKELHKTYEWNYKVNADAAVVFNNYDCDLVIHTWNKAEMKYQMTIDATMSSEEDAADLAAYLKSMTHNNSPGRVSIENRFWSKRVNVAGRKTISLREGKNLRYSDMTMSGELWIPENSQLELTSKYSRLEVEKVINKLILNLYNDKLYGNECGSVELTAKYATIELQDVSDMKALLYNCDLYTGNMGNSTIESKYSTVSGKDAGDMEISSYNDKFSFTSTGKIGFTSKYSDLNSGKSSDIVIDSYEGNFNISKPGRLTVTSKYSKFEFGEAVSCSITSAYNSRFIFKSIKSADINESKYGTYEIGTLGESFSMVAGYNDKITITAAGKDFKGFAAGGKYVKTELGLPQGLSFRFRADIKYPKLEMDEEKLSVRIKIVENSTIKYDAVMGTESDGMPLIDITGYEMTFILKQ